MKKLVPILLIAVMLLTLAPFAMADNAPEHSPSGEGGSALVEPDEGTTFAPEGGDVSATIGDETEGVTIDESPLSLATLDGSPEGGAMDAAERTEPVGTSIARQSDTDAESRAIDNRPYDAAPTEAEEEEPALGATSGTCGDNLTWTLNSGVLTISGTGAMTSWESASDAPWYANRSSIKKVVINSGVTTIGYSSFQSYPNLTSVSLGGGLQNIERLAFYQCPLSSLLIPAGVQEISDTAFSGCGSLTSIQVASGNTSFIAQNGVLFSKNTTVLYIYPAGKSGTYTVPYGVNRIADFAFCGCSSLTGISIPDTVTEIDYDAFYNCPNLPYTVYNNAYYLGNDSNPYSCLIYAPNAINSTFSIHNRTRVIAGGAMEEHTDLTSITIPYGVVSIGSGAFYGCSNLTNVIIPSSVTSLGVSAFNACSRLTNVTIPNSVTSIGHSAFCLCSSLTSVTIPSSVTSVGSCAFQSCSSLKSVSILGRSTSIDHSAFSYCTSLTSVTIGNGVKSIGDAAFYECSSLTSVSIPNSVTSIGNRSFYGCSSLRSVTIPNSVTSIDDYSFSTSGLTSISIPNSVTGIGEGAFFDCQNLANITIGSGVKTIGEGAFCNCQSLASITIGSGVKTIGESAFHSCTSLKSISIPAGVTDVSKDAFRNCPNLEEVTICGATTLYVSPFSGCTNLKRFVVPSSNTKFVSVNGFLFYKDRSRLCCCPPGFSGSYTIPNSVKNIDYAFINCTLLTSVTIPDSVTEIGYSAFDGCSALKGVTIPDSVTCIDEGAFYGCTSLAHVYYSGTQAQWDAITIEEGNEALSSAMIHVHTHSYTATVVTAATCTGQGERRYSCTCGDSYTETITALGHNLTHHAAKNATCLTSGWNAYDTCSRCSYSTYSAIPALGHDYKSQVTTAATCETDGVRTYTCTHDASHRYSETIPALGHIWSSGLVVTSATCTADGVRKYTCTRNTNHTYTETIPALGHTFVVTERKTATRTEDGYEVRKCTRCNQTTRTVFPAHIPGDPNSDGVVNGKDVTTLRRHLAGGYSVTILEIAADVNHDGEVNGKDVTMLRRYLAGGYGVTLE